MKTLSGMQRLTSLIIFGPVERMRVFSIIERIILFEQRILHLMNVFGLKKRLMSLILFSAL